MLLLLAAGSSTNDAPAEESAPAVVAAGDDSDDNSAFLFEPPGPPSPTPTPAVAPLPSVVPPPAAPGAVAGNAATPAPPSQAVAPAAGPPASSVAATPVGSAFNLPTPWVGVNNWALAASSDVYSGCGGASEAWLDEKLQVVRQAEVDVIRFAAYQSFAIDKNHGRNWAALDRVFARAQAHGIKLIPVLGNNWVDCDYWGTRPAYNSKSEGTPVYCGGTGNWYDVGYKQPYDGYLTGYDQWVTDVVTRYSRHPALAAWEVINEPWETCSHNFFVDATSRIRAADPATPISLGGDANGWDYVTENSLPNVNWTTSHDYTRPKEPLPSGVAADIRDSQMLGKAHYIGEAGVDCDSDGEVGDPDDDTALCNPCDSQLRADYIEAKIRASFQAGSVGYIVWAYSHSTAAGSCSHNFGPNSPVMHIFRKF